MDKNDIVVLENSLKYLRLHCIWPNKILEGGPGKIFYIKFIFVTMSTSLLLWGSLAHMIAALYVDNGAQIDLDISIIVSLIATYYFNFCYLVNVKQIEEAYRDLSNFNLFGTPTGFSGYNKYLNKLSKWHYSYICSLVLILFITTPILDLNNCQKNNLEKGLNEVCGLMTNVWFPFDVDYLPMKQFLNVVQLYSIYNSYVLSSTISFSIVETIEHVNFRLKHVRTSFVEALNGENYKTRRRLLDQCILYHNFVIRLAQKLGKSYEKCVFVHILLTGIILGLAGYQIFQGPPLITIAIFVGWCLSVVMVAIGGQHLIDECLSIGTAIYNTKWYDLELNIQKDVALVLLRCQKPEYLRVGPFGFMSLQMILSILKTSYSIASLIRATSFNK